VIADVMTEMTTRRTTNRTATDANHRANNNSTDADDQMVERGRDLARLSKEEAAAGRAARLEGRSKTNSEKPIKEGAMGEEQAHAMTALYTDDEWRQRDFHQRRYSRLTTHRTSGGRVG
jgi:hypothetical protein